MGLNSIVWICKKMMEQGALVWNIYHCFVSFFFPSKLGGMRGKKDIL